VPIFAYFIISWAWYKLLFLILSLIFKKLPGFSKGALVMSLFFICEVISWTRKCYFRLIHHRPSLFFREGDCLRFVRRIYRIGWRRRSYLVYDSRTASWKGVFFWWKCIWNVVPKIGGKLLCWARNIGVIAHQARSFETNHVLFLSNKSFTDIGKSIL